MLLCHHLVEEWDHGSAGQLLKTVEALAPGWLPSFSSCKANRREQRTVASIEVKRRVCVQQTLNLPYSIKKPTNSQ